MGGDPFIRTGSSVKANKPRVGPLADCSKPENSFPVLVDRTDVVVILIFVTVKFEGVELKFSFSRVAFAQPAIDRPNPNDAGSIVHDGRDVSWIWDVDFENLPKESKIFISGDRAYDMALRIKYLDSTQNFNSNVRIFENLRGAIKNAISETSTGEALFVLPTYSAMLETRKILTGRKIL